MASPARQQLWSAKIANARGDVPPGVKEKLAAAMLLLTNESDFGDPIITRLKVTELSVFDRSEDGKKQAKATFELAVQEGMLNARKGMHGGCMAYLVDVCSSIALSLLALATDGSFELVSQSINMIYHSGANLGDKLEIVNTTVSSGSRAVSARTEIWDVTNRRLVASGTHIKMKPGVPKPKL